MIFDIDTFYIFWFGFLSGTTMLSFGLAGLIYSDKSLPIRPIVCSFLGGISGTMLIFLSFHLGVANSSTSNSEIREVLSLLFFTSSFAILLHSKYTWKKFFVKDYTQEKTI